MPESACPNFNKMCKKTNYKGTSNTQLDMCMKPVIKWLNNRDYFTVSSCCGHDKYPMTIVVKYMINGIERHKEILSNAELPRKRKFYKKDKKGYYYIPEVSGKDGEITI